MVLSKFGHFHCGWLCAEFLQHTRPCWHASAARDLLPEETDWVADLSAADLHERISDVALDSCPVAIIYSNRHNAAGLALSVALSEAGHPRCIVGAESDGTLCCRNAKCRSKGHRYSCAHCKMVADQLRDNAAQLDDEDMITPSTAVEEMTALSAELQGLHLKLHGRQVVASQTATAVKADSKLPISRAKIPHNLHSSVMVDRASGKLGETDYAVNCAILKPKSWILSHIGQLSMLVATTGGLLPKCLHCQSHGCECCHCVPPMPTDLTAVCSECNAPWSTNDPVAQAWITQANATLVSCGSLQRVIVYHRMCSNRCGVKRCTRCTECCFVPSPLTFSKPLNVALFTPLLQLQGL